MVRGVGGLEHDDIELETSDGTLSFLTPVIRGK